VFIGETEIQFYEAQTDTLIYIFSDDTTKTFFQDKTAKKIFRRVSELSKNNLQAYKSNDYFYIQIATEALRDGKTRLVIASNELKYDVLLFERISADTWVLAAIEDSRGNQEAKDWD
jgi:myo-inositol-hexaphosphate 3-phosphohydrolase